MSGRLRSPIDHVARRLASTSVAGLLLSAAALYTLPTSPSKANDSSAELATGGLIFTKNDSVEMRSEDLFISSQQIRVRYRFLNKTNSDVDVHVAFPLPDLKKYRGDDVIVRPVKDPIDFLGFATTVNGQRVRSNVEQKIYLDDREETQTLRHLGIPLSPYFSQDAVAKLSATEKNQLTRLGLIDDDKFPLWTLKTTFYWQQLFPAGRETLIDHQYKPSVGTTVAIDNANIVGLLQGDTFCPDADLLNSLRRAKGSYFSQQRIEYVLRTGANWSGPIKDVDKGSPDNFVTFCGQGVRRIGPTQFEMAKTDFTPRDDIAVLILKREQRP